MSAHEHAIQLAQDPVAAADFFDFSVKCCFENLLGWDYTKQRSCPGGGLFGHLCAFYGTSEYTECGSLHGHFLLWLVGGMNPSELHVKLHDEKYQNKLFSFFDDIIHHHLPDIGISVERQFEPRVEHPPKPPSPSILSADPNTMLAAMKEWDTIFISEIKKCGEVLQCHHCHAVCHKYGNEDKCCFLFPHEVIEASYFDKGLIPFFLSVEMVL